MLSKRKHQTVPPLSNSSLKTSESKRKSRYEKSGDKSGGKSEMNIDDDDDFNMLDGASDIEEEDKMEADPNFEREVSQTYLLTYLRVFISRLHCTELY